jgi:hypothetical protein
LQSPFFFFWSIAIRQFEVQRWALPALAFLQYVFVHTATSQTAAAARASDTQAMPAKNIIESSAHAKRDIGLLQQK